VCNPNNPTGTMVSQGEVDAFMEAVPDDVIVVFDEAYYEYVRSNEYPESLRYVTQNRPVVVLRTFSKIYGLAGLRVGYGISTLEIMDYLNRVRPPFNSNSLAQAAALAALDDEGHVAKSRAMNITEMGVVENELAKMGVSPIPSQANFIYFDTKRDGRQVFHALLQKGVIVRHIKGSMIRVTVGQAFENQRFLEALQEVLTHFD
ncbi:MAG: aminotransferase class I/II-fold pyridoxal phosphate-dependent enzyme, partial [Nitrospirales bacterium]|nr:aminotransferase class I/II-fold pyridoxal phosphate-dependent enzyme [Nitrospirales bacterium]